jgi:hypothetical protein
MPYPWPLDNPDVALQDALDIAMDYLEFTGQAYPFSETERLCAQTIMKTAQHIGSALSRSARPRWCGPDFRRRRVKSIYKAWPRDYQGSGVAGVEDGA